MDLSTTYDHIKYLKGRIEAKGLQPEVDLFLDYIGTEVYLSVRAAEPYNVNGYWQRGKSFEGRVEDIDHVLDEAHKWITSLPDAENRAVEFTIQKLAEIANKLPTTGSAAMQHAMDLVKTSLMNQADELAKRGLPAPYMISEAPRKAPKEEGLSDEVPF